MSNRNKVTDPDILAELNKTSDAKDESAEKDTANQSVKVTDKEIIRSLQEDFSLPTMVSNIPSSALQYGKDLAQPFIHPVDTANGLLDLGGDLLAKGEQGIVNALPEWVVNGGNRINNSIADATGLLTRLPENKADMIPTPTPTADAAGAFFSDRYGSVNQAKKTLMQDPVGALGDASAVITGGATLLPKASKVAQAVKGVGRALDPVNAALNTGKYATAKLTPASLPASLYESAAKFSTTLKDADRSKLVATALKHDLMPNGEGVGKLGSKVRVLGDAIDEIINTADDAGIDIPANKVLKYLDELKSEAGGFKLNAGKDTAEINKIIDTFNEMVDDRVTMVGDQVQYGMVKPSELQAFKQDLYKGINWNRKQQTGTRVAEDVEKAMAKAAKEELELLDPRLKDFNAQQGELLELSPHLERSAHRIDNRNPLSIDTGLLTTAGAVSGDLPGAVAGGLLSLSSYPKVQAGTALNLNKAKRMGLLGFMNNSPGQTALQQGLFQAGRNDRVNP